MCRVLTITTSKEISVEVVDWSIFPYHEIGILTGRPGGEGGKAMSSCEDKIWATILLRALPSGEDGKAAHCIAYSYLHTIKFGIGNADC